MMLKMNESKLVLANPSTVTVKMDAEDKKKLKEHAKSEGVSLSDFIRKCINHYINPDEDNTNSDVAVDEVDYLMDYTEKMVDPDFIADADLSDREGYRKDDDGYEYFIGEHVDVDYTEPIELRRTPEGYIEFRLLDDDRGFVFASYDIWNINHAYLF